MEANRTYNRRFVLREEGHGTYDAHIRYRQIGKVLTGTKVPEHIDRTVMQLGDRTASAP